MWLYIQSRSPVRGLPSQNKSPFGSVSTPTTIPSRHLRCRQGQGYSVHPYHSDPARCPHRAPNQSLEPVGATGVRDWRIPVFVLKNVKHTTCRCCFGGRGPCVGTGVVLARRRLPSRAAAARKPKSPSATVCACTVRLRWSVTVKRFCQVSDLDAFAHRGLALRCGPTHTGGS
jgi:hypothetical protein